MPHDASWRVSEGNGEPGVYCNAAAFTKHKRLPLPIDYVCWLLIVTLAAADDAPSAESPLLLLPIAGPTEAAQALDGELAAALRSRLGNRAIVTISELNVAFSAERTKDVLGCDDTSCLTDVLGALGGRFALGVQLAPGTPLATVTLILRDLDGATRAFRIERRTPSLAPAQLRSLAADLAGSLLGTAGWVPTQADTPATSRSR